MISRLIGGFVSILIGVSLIGPISTETLTATEATLANGTCASTGGIPATSHSAGCQLYQASSWGATVLKLVPGFFALGILGIGIAVTYGSLRDAGVV